MDVTVAIATFGELRWLDQARRAVAAAEQLGVPIVVAHGRALHEARNAALSMVRSEWVCFLDADDELEVGYFDAMSTMTADLRAPAVRYIRGAHAARPYVPRVAGHDHECNADCLPFGNWLIVGTVARTDLIRRVGGWWDWPMYEDWCLWLRCHLAGATVEAVPDAVYRAYVHTNSRNRAPSAEDRLEAHRMIARAHGVPVP